MSYPVVDHEAVVDLTRDLVRIDSVNREGRREEAAARLVVDRMAGFGWKVQTDEVAPCRPNVIATVEGGRPGPTLMFEGHTDVVTEGDRAEWSHDPFGAEIVDGRIYGRGAADMKGGVAAMIHAVRAVETAGPFPGRIMVGILCDEEGMMLGAKHFVAAGHADGVDAAIVGEPEAGEVCVTQKGAIRLRIDANGTMAHGAMPHQGANPVAALAMAAGRLSALQDRLQSIHGEDPHLGWPYATPTVFEAGSLPQLNVIPATGTLAADIRTIPGIEHEGLFTWIETELESITASTGVGLQLDVIDDRPPTETPAGHPVVRAVARAHRQITGHEPVLGGVPGTTDGTILHRDAGLPVVVYGPGGKWIAHQVDEYVEIDDLTTSAEVYAVAALEYLTAGAS